MRSAHALLALSIIAIPAIAHADDPAPDASAPAQQAPQAAPTPPPQPERAAAPLPPPTSAFGGQLVDQAGAATNLRYGQVGVLEVGAAAGLTLASNLRDVNFSPSLGYFMNDNFELSGILSVSNVKAGNESSTVWSALAEPSFHFPLERTMFAFVGVGIGAAYIDRLGTALAVAPRVGFNFLVGRSGVLTPSLSYEYTTHDTMQAAASDGTTDVTLVAVSSTLRANIGYTVMW